MRFLMINIVCGIRSTGRICTDIAVELEKNGHDVRIAYGRGNVPERFKKNAYRIGNDFDVMCHGIKARLSDGSGYGSKEVTKKFIDWIKGYNPDVIHLHNVHGYYINIEELFDYLRTSGKKLIWTLHDSWAFTGHAACCDEADCNRWKEGCFSCPIINKYPKSLVDRSSRNWKKKKALMNNIPDLTLVTPSKWLANSVKESFLKQYPLKIIHNGIDTSIFHPVDNNVRELYDVKEKYLILGVASSWSAEKGLYDFFDLAEMLDENYQIILVGLTKKQIKKMPKTIIGVEKTNSAAELACFYAAADIFINPTYDDNYPTVNLEAVACGTPVLTYNTGGSPESAGKDAIIVPKGDVQAIYDSVTDTKVLKAEKVYEEIDLNAIDYKSMVNNYLELVI